MMEGYTNIPIRYFSTFRNTITCNRAYGYKDKTGIRQATDKMKREAVNVLPELKVN